MTVKDVLETIEFLKNQGHSEDDIARSFYLMYVDNKINIDQLKALLEVLKYKLPKSFWELSKEEQIKYFIK